MASHKARGVQFVGDRIVNPPSSAASAGRSVPLTADQLSTMERGGAIYAELCFSCHGDDGRGTPVPGARAGSVMAPSLSGSTRVTGHPDYVIKPLLHGMSGPIDGRTYPQVMAPLGSNRDQWIADIASFVRNSFGNVSDVGYRRRRRQGSSLDDRSNEPMDARRARSVAATVIDS